MSPSAVVVTCRCASTHRLRITRTGSDGPQEGTQASARTERRADTCVPNRVTAQVTCYALSVVVCRLQSLKAARGSPQTRGTPMALQQCQGVDHPDWLDASPAVQHQ